MLCQVLKTDVNERANVHEIHHLLRCAIITFSFFFFFFFFGFLCFNLVSPRPISFVCLLLASLFITELSIVPTAGVTDQNAAAYLQAGAALVKIQEREGARKEGLGWSFVPVM